jgi:MFS family permease
MAQQTSELDPRSGKPLRWYQGLDRYCWVVLAVATLGWLFDMMDQNLYTLIRVPSLRDILSKTISDPAALDAAVKDKAGIITAIFLIGWSVGGFIFGILGDRIGRTKTMILTILTYAIFTGINGLVQSWQGYALARFMTSLGVGGEWAAGAALVAEVFPQRSRAMALGMLQSLSAVGNMMAATLTLVIGNMDAHWRWVYFIGAAPALLVFWVAKSVKEPEAWQQAKKTAVAGKELGNYKDLFTHPKLRHNLLVAVLMATAGIGGLWGVGYFSPDLLRSELVKAAWSPKVIGRCVAIMFFCQQVGALIGMVLFAPFAERFGRRPAFTLWFALAWASVIVFFWGVAGSGGGAYHRALMLAPILGFCTLGPLSGFTIYFPELFPTRLRATGCGFGYNAARIFAAAAPFAIGPLAIYFTKYGPNKEILQSGYAMAATIVSVIYLCGFLGVILGPETKGMPLPEDKDFEVPAPPATAANPPAGAN